MGRPPLVAVMNQRYPLHAIRTRWGGRGGSKERGSGRRIAGIWVGPHHLLASPTGGTAMHTEITIEVSGELDLAASGAFEAQLAAAYAESGPRRVLVNLRKVEFLSSAALAVLVRAHRAAMDRDARMVIVAPTRQTLRLLQITGLDSELDVQLDSPAGS
ncbi:anti-sigma factor antagonist [Pseudonocardiaceae bacterium YIM PH 21723]|nr:anti-sigma factor antagonist [Pseudonocardiaceae bacterium YIM PH 21723]